MTITLTCIMQPGQNPEADRPLVAVRSDRLDRSLCPDELEKFQERFKPEWHQVQTEEGCGTTPVVYSAEVDLLTPGICQCCKEEVPMQYMTDNLICPKCQELPAELQIPVLQG